MQKEEDLRQVKVQVATCAKCGGAVKMAVTDKIDRATSREFAKHTRFKNKLNNENRSKQ